MPAKRELTMRQLMQMLRLAHDGVSAREIGAGHGCGVARSTIQDNLKRAAAAGLNWPLPEDLSDDALEKRLFAHAGVKTGARRRVEPDWAGTGAGAKTRRRHHDDLVGGISLGASGWLWLQPVLRSASRR